MHTGHCTCMAGQGTVCSHVAALLIKLETAIHFKLNEPTASTSELCKWKSCKKSVKPAWLSEIVFKKPKQGMLPLPQTHYLENVVEHISKNDPTSGEDGFSAEELRLLYESNPTAAVFTSIDCQDFIDTVPVNDHGNGSDTDSDTENNETCVPEPILSLFDPSSINMSDNEIKEHSKKRYLLFAKAYSRDSYNNLTDITTYQAKSSAWQIHRGGRITASFGHQVFRTNSDSPSATVMNTIMQYKETVGNKYTNYGIKMEPAARAFFRDNQASKHTNLRVIETGFHVKQEIPYLGASPDGIIYCDCHETRLLEIKCPYKYKEGLSNWQNDPDFPLNSSGVVKESHPYYTQMQLQMFVCDAVMRVFNIFSSKKLPGCT